MERATTPQGQPFDDTTDEVDERVVTSKRPSPPSRWFFSFNGWTGTERDLYDEFVLA